MQMGFGLTCGHCGHRLRIRTSKSAHVCLRIIHLQCTNMLCGATYRGFVEVEYQYSPSACPSPNFVLPSPPQHVRNQDIAQLFRKENSAQIDLIDELDQEPGEQGATG